MKSIIASICLLAISAVAQATVIDVTEPNFTADKIELNKVTNSYVVVKPKYYINAAQALPILGHVNNVSDSVIAGHLCSFLGMKGGNIISTVTPDPAYDCTQTMAIEKNGLYRRGNSGDYGSYSCSVIEFLECNP